MTNTCIDMQHKDYRKKPNAAFFLTLSAFFAWVTLRLSHMRMKNDESTAVITHRQANLPVRFHQNIPIH